MGGHSEAQLAGPLLLSEKIIEPRADLAQADLLISTTSRQCALGAVGDRLIVLSVDVPPTIRLDADGSRRTGQVLGERAEKVISIDVAHHLQLYVED